MTTVQSRLAFFIALPLLAAACKSGPSTPGDHWTLDSVPQRIVKQFTGYRFDRDGSYIDFQYRKKKSIDRTLRRHFLNNSPDSPFEADDPSQTKRRPPHSPAPDPLAYMHLESLAFGGVMMGLSGGFVPIPVDSLIATLDGGWDEFGRGFTQGADAEAESPPSVSQFKVKNR